MYILNIFQQIICGGISRQNQRREKSLGTIETTYLLEINKFEFISEGHGKKKTRKQEKVMLFDIKKYHKPQECVGECRQMQGKM